MNKINRSKKLDLQIVDSFFSKKELKYWHNFIRTLAITPRHDKEGNHFGFRKDIKIDEGTLLKIKNKFHPNKDFKQIAPCIHLRHNYEKPLVHTDLNEYNFICYLKGPPLFNNGTGFYYGNDLRTHVGFVENRAIFFNGKDTFHTDLQAFGDSSPRYTLNIFYGEKVYG